MNEKEIKQKGEKSRRRNLRKEIESETDIFGICIVE
jgi:hypothetical protein